MKVLVTGATEGFGLFFVKKLSDDERVSQIIGLKSSDLDYVDFDEIDEAKLSFETAKNLRPRALEDVFKKNHDIDVVVHLAYSDNSGKIQKGKSFHETNVFGTMRVLDLCEKYGVKKFIYKSPSSIYGAYPDNPALIKEDFPLRGDREYQALRDKIEADIMCQLHIKENHFPKVVVLRFCGIIGTHTRSPLNTIFKQAFVPMVMGFDPMFQIIHESDVASAIITSIFNDKAEGVFNIAGKKIRPLSEVIKNLGKVPVPIAGIAIKMYEKYFMQNREYSFPFDLNYWKYPFVIDTTKAKEILKFEAKVL